MMTDLTPMHVKQAIANLESRMLELEEENSILRAKVDGIENKFVRDVEDEARGYHRKPSEAHWQEFFRSQKEAELARAVLDAAVKWYADYWFDHSVGGRRCGCPACVLQNAVRAYEAAQKGDSQCMEETKAAGDNGDAGNRLFRLELTVAKNEEDIRKLDQQFQPLYEAVNKQFESRQGAGDSAHSPTSIPGPSTSAATPSDENRNKELQAVDPSGC
jgi:hypothetical protein